MHKTPIDQIERVARVFHSNQDASRALGINPQAFSRLCHQNGIGTPYARMRRRRQRIPQP